MFKESERLARPQGEESEILSIIPIAFRTPGQALGKPFLKKEVQIMPIVEAMHQVHTHLLTEESLVCQPLLLLCRKVSGRLGKSFLFRG